MSLTDSIAEALNIKETPIADAVVSGPTSTPLTPDEQAYANEMNQILNGPEAANITDSASWKEFITRESLKLSDEDYNAMMDRDMRALVKGEKGLTDFQQSAYNFAKLRNQALTEGLPGAVGVSVARQLMAQAYVDNPEMNALPRSTQEYNEHFGAKLSIIEDAVRMAQYNADEAGAWSKTKYGLSEAFPIPFLNTSAYTFSDPVEAIGQDTSSWNRIGNMRKFRDLVTAKFYDTSISPVEFGNWLDKNMKDMYAAGVNPSRVSALFDTLEEFNPGTELIYAGLDAASLAQIPYRVAYGAIKGTTLASKAGRALGGAIVGVAEQIPFGVKAVTTLNSRIVDAAVKGTADGLSKVGKMKRAGNAKGAAEELLKDLGEPTERAGKERVKKIYWDHAVDDAAKPDVLADRSLSRTAPITSNKVLEEQEARVISRFNTFSQNLAKKRNELLKSIYEEVADVLKAEEVYGDIKGLNGVLKSTEPQMTTDGNLIVSVRLDKQYMAKPVYHSTEPGTATDADLFTRNVDVKTTKKTKGVDTDSKKHLEFIKKRDANAETPKNGYVKTSKAYQKDPTKAIVKDIKEALAQVKLSARAKEVVGKEILDVFKNGRFDKEALMKSHHAIMYAMDREELLAAIRGQIKSRAKQLGYKIPAPADQIIESTSKMRQVVNVANDPGRKKALTEMNKIVKAMTEHGHKVEGHLELTPQGYWNIRLDFNTQKGFGTMFMDTVDMKQTGWRGFLSGVFTATSNPTDVRILNSLRHLDASTIRQNAEQLGNAYNALSKDKRALFDSIRLVSEKFGAEYDLEHLLQRGVDPEVVDLYGRWLIFNDWDYILMNAAERQDLAYRGVKVVKYNDIPLAGGRGLGREIKFTNADEMVGKLNREQRDIVFNSTDIGAAKPIREINDKSLRDAFKRGYRVFEAVVSNVDNVKAKTAYFLLDPKALEIQELPQFIMSYVPGGRRFFDRSASYVKQLRIEKMASGRDAIVGTSTFMTDLDSTGLIKRTAKLEEIRQAIVHNDLAKADRLIAEADFKKAPFKNANEFKQWAKQWDIDIIHEQNALEVVKEGTPLSSYDRITKSLDADKPLLLDNEYNMFHRSRFQALDTEAKMQKAHRTGKDLMTYDFDIAEPADFEHNLRYMVNDMVHKNLMSNFTDFYAERFAKTFGDAGVIMKSDVTLPKEMLFARIIETAGNEKIAAAARTAQKNYQVIRSVPTDFDKAAAKFVSGAFRTIGNAVQDFFHVTEPVAHGVRLNLNKFVNSDPLGYIRAMTSHWYLGMFNVSQLWKQAAAVTAVASMDLPHFLKAHKYAFPFTLALAGAQGDVEKALLKFAPEMTSKEKRVLYENLVRMGTFEHGVAGGFLESRQTTKNLLNKVSMGPFNYGEMFNRVVANLTALYKFGMHEKAMTVDELGKVLEYGNNMFMKMDAVGLARAQTSTIGKTMLQFMGYRMKWVESVLFDKELTGNQRAMLALVNSILVGGEGMLGVAGWNMISNCFNSDTTAETLTQDQEGAVRRFLSRGLLNYWSDQPGGIDIDFGGPVDLSLFDTADLFTGIGHFELPSVTALGKMGQGLMRVREAVSRGFFEGFTKDDFNNYLQVMAQDGSLPPSVSKPLLGYLLWKTGKQFNAQGRLTLENNSAMQAILTGLGFSTLSSKDLYKAMIQYSDAKKAEEILYKNAKEWYNQLSREFNPAVEAKLQALFRMSPLSDRVKSKVLQRLSKEALQDSLTPYVHRLARRQYDNAGDTGNNLILKFNEGEQ